MKSDLFPGLTDIVFADKAADEIERDIITLYEQIAERTIAKGDPIRLFLETMTLIIIHQRSLIDHAAKQNLLAYSEGDYLDHIGALLGVTRLEATKAMTTLKFTLSEIQDENIIIPKGTRATPGGNILFATVESAEILAGQREITITAECTEAGTLGNNYIAGQIRRLVDVFPYEMSVENISESCGGSDIENDENFRERIQLAPESFSNAGSKGAYTFYARSAYQDIIDVAVIGPPDISPGNVDIYPLLTGGVIPTQEILNIVYETCNNDSVRPDTDYLHVKQPEIVNYNLSVKYFIDRANSSTSATIAANIETAINEWIKWQRVKLGRDINPSELNYRIIQAGAKRCEIYSPVFTVLRPYQIAVINQISITYGGLEEH